ncbi:MAG TPA: NADH:ubiquinone oxidoreductase subunit NDUFA12 [Rhodospirillaceae bacterium]|nr:NADH:ubiquinone oxidoreductase subunit NDUFA12 [Rhodospirillaceae bacterium]
MFSSLSLVRRVSQLGTILATLFGGVYVGRDSFGNRYFKSRFRNKARKEKRWVFYAGAPEPTMIPSQWFGWIHFMCDLPLPNDGQKSYQWIKPHQPNLTGSDAAYFPEDHIFSILAQGKPHNDANWQPSK